MLINNGIVTGLSLPLVTRGFDELIFSDKIEEGDYVDSWDIEWPGGKVTFTSGVKIDQPELFAGASFEEEEEEEDDDDGEFL